PAPAAACLAKGKTTKDPGSCFTKASKCVVGAGAAVPGTDGGAPADDAPAEEEGKNEESNCCVFAFAAANAAEADEALKDKDEEGVDEDVVEGGGRRGLSRHSNWRRRMTL
ncbi:hypothetical protein HK102_011204, partial [Quaeritorhiza haematococci]